MPTILIKNGKRSLKLTKREHDILFAAGTILLDVSANFYDDDQDMEGRIDDARDVLDAVSTAANSKPAKTVADIA